MDSITTKIVTPPHPIDDAKTVRQKVFQEEQGIAGEMDFDGNDDLAIHVIVYHRQTPVGTGRIRKVNERTVKIERVAVIKEMRGHGLGKLIMQTINNHLSKTGTIQVTLDAQLHAKDFYESLGYSQVGEVFEEVGIPHVFMVKKFK